MAIKVDGVEIPEEEILGEIEGLRHSYEEYVRKASGDPSEEQLRKWAIENLIEDHLFRKAAMAGQPVPSEERVQKELKKNAEKYAKVPAQQQFARASVMLQHRRMLKELDNEVPVPDAEALKAYYIAHPDMFVAPEALRLSHLCRNAVYADRPSVYLELLRIKSDLDQQTLDWQSALTRYSESFDKDKGYFALVARGELPAEIEDKLFGLADGAVSDVLDLGFGTLHLFRVDQRVPAEKLTFVQIKDTLKQHLHDQNRVDHLHQKLDELKAAAVIEWEA